MTGPRWLATTAVLLTTGFASAAEPDTFPRVSTSVTVTQRTVAAVSVPLDGLFAGRVGDTVILAGGVAEGMDATAPAGISGRRTLVAESPGLPGQDPSWRSATGEPVPAMAFGAACAAADGLLCIGGLEAGGISARVYEVPGAPAGAVTSLPELPVPLLGAAAARVRNTVYVAGGLTATNPAAFNRLVYELDLDSLQGSAGGGQDPAPGWTIRARLPDEAPGLLKPVLIARFDDRTDQNALLLLGGWRGAPGGGFRPSSEARYFLMNRAMGSSVEEWRPLAAAPAGWVVSSGIAFGQSYSLLAARPAADARVSPAQALKAADTPHRLLLFDFITDTWTELPSHPPLASAPLLLAASRETFDVLTSEGVAVCAVEEAKRRFPALAYLVVVLYVVGMLVLGAYFDRRGKGKGLNEFVLGGRKVHWLVAGLSMYATGISAYSFAGIPGKSYAANWLRFGEPLVAFVGMLIVGYILFPLFRRLNLTTMTEYMELRFSKTIRTFGGLQYVLGQLAARMAGVVLLPAMALTAVTGINIYQCIMLVGLLATIYTVMGGLNAVVWTDVAQIVVLFGGAIAAIIALIAGIDGGLGTILQVSREYGKMHAFDWTPDLHSMTVWVFMLWGLTDMMGRLGQENMQRAFATDGETSARRSMITCALVSVPGAVVFFFIGTAVFVFYKTHPQMIDPKLGAESMFPLFMAQSMHPAIAGLVIAGLFAAAMSTLDSGMHSTATVITKDWFAAFNKNSSDRTQLITAKVATTVMGILGTAAALYVASFRVRSVWDYFGKSMGLIGGGLAGVMVLALFTKRAHTRGVLLGGLVNLVIMILWTRTHVHWIIYGITNTVIASLLGYVFSLLIPPSAREKDRDLSGLTLWTMAPGKKT